MVHNTPRLVLVPKLSYYYNCKVNARFNTGGGCCDRSECSQELGNCLLQLYRKPAAELSDAEAKV
jgi:hypothetical protein